MKAKELSLLGKVAHIALAFALVVSMTPICVSQNAQTAMATEGDQAPTQASAQSGASGSGGTSASNSSQDAASQGDAQSSTPDASDVATNAKSGDTNNSINAPDTSDQWYYWSSIYPADYQAKNTKSAYTDDEIKDTVNEVCKSDGYQKHLENELEDLNDHIVKHAKKKSSGEGEQDSLVFDTSDTSTLKTEHDIFFSSVIGTLDSSSGVLSLKNNTPIVTGVSTKGEKIQCYVEKEHSFQISYLLTAKKAGATSDADTETLKVRATNTNGTVVLELASTTDESAIVESEPYTIRSTDSFLQIPNIITTPKITSVQAEDAKTLSDYLENTGIDTSYTGVEFSVELPDTLYGTENYNVVNTVSTDEWTVSKAGKTLKVKKNSASASTDNLKLQFYVGDNPSDTTKYLFTNNDGTSAPVTPTTNTNTKDADQKAVAGSLSSQFLDLSYIDDSAEVTISGLERKDYKVVTYDSSCSLSEGKYSEPDENGKYTLTFTVTRNEAVTTLNEASCIKNGFKFGLRIGDVSTENNLFDLDKFPSITITENTRKADIDKVNAAISKIEKLDMSFKGDTAEIDLSQKVDSETGETTGLGTGYGISYNSDDYDGILKVEKDESNPLKITITRTEDQKDVGSAECVQKDFMFSFNVYYKQEANKVRDDNANVSFCEEKRKTDKDFIEKQTSSRGDLSFIDYEQTINFSKTYRGGEYKAELVSPSDDYFEIKGIEENEGKVSIKFSRKANPSDEDQTVDDTIHYRVYKEYTNEKDEIEKLYLNNDNEDFTFDTKLEVKENDARNLSGACDGKSIDLSLPGDSSASDPVSFGQSTPDIEGRGTEDYIIKVDEEYKGYFTPKIDKINNEDGNYKETQISFTREKMGDPNVGTNKEGRIYFNLYTKNGEKLSDTSFYVEVNDQTKKNDVAHIGEAFADGDLSYVGWQKKVTFTQEYVGTYAIKLVDGNNTEGTPYDYGKYYSVGVGATTKGDGTGTTSFTITKTASIENATELPDKDKVYFDVYAVVSSEDGISQEEIKLSESSFNISASGSARATDASNLQTAITPVNNAGGIDLPYVNLEPSANPNNTSIALANGSYSIDGQTIATANYKSAKVTGKSAEYYACVLTPGITETKIEFKRIKQTDSEDPLSIEFNLYENEGDKEVALGDAPFTINVAKESAVINSDIKAVEDAINRYYNNGLDLSWESDCKEVVVSGLYFNDYELVGYDEDLFGVSVTNRMPAEGGKFNLTFKVTRKKDINETLAYLDKVNGGFKFNLLKKINETENYLKDRSQPFTIKVNQQTREDDVKAVTGKTKNSIDLSFVGDGDEYKQSITLSELKRDDYKVIVSDKESKKYFDVSYDKETKALTFSRKLQGGPNSIKFNLYTADNEGNILGDSDFEIAVNTNKKDEDETTVTTAFSNFEKQIQPTYGDDVPTIIDLKSDNSELLNFHHVYDIECKSGDESMNYSDYYEVKYDPQTSQLQIIPKQATANKSVPVEINFFVSNGVENPAQNNTLGTFTLNVTVNKKELTFDPNKIPEFSYRYKDNQCEKVKGMLESWISDGLVEGDDGNGEGVLDESSIYLFQSNGNEYGDGSSNQTVTVRNIKIRNDNYTFKELNSKTNISNETNVKTVNINVRAIAEAGFDTIKDELSYTGVLGNGEVVDIKDGRWINHGVTISRGGYKLADPVSKGGSNLPDGWDNYLDSLQPSALNPESAEGELGGKFVYAWNMNEGENKDVITKITNLSAKIDKTGPHVTSFAINNNGDWGEQRTLGEKLLGFFFKSSTRAEV